MKDIRRRTQQNLEVSEPPPPSDQFGYDQKVTTVTVRSYLPSVAALLALLWTGCHQQSANAPGTGSQFDTSPVSELNAANQGGAPDPLVRTDDQWRQLLTPEQYSITRKKGTEPPRSGKYWNSTKSGIYRCVCCGAELFSSQHKYDSGTGWPSFWKPLNPSTVGTERDDSLFWESRVEVHCRKCAAHLGHVFEDGPQPTGLRYCINSVALKLDPDLAPDP